MAYRNNGEVPLAFFHVSFTEGNRDHCTDEMLLAIVHNRLLRRQCHFGQHHARTDFLLGAMRHVSMALAELHHAAATTSVQNPYDQSDKAAMAARLVLNNGGPEQQTIKSPTIVGPAQPDPPVKIVDRPRIYIKDGGLFIRSRKVDGPIMYQFRVTDLAHQHHPWRELVVPLANLQSELGDVEWELLKTVPLSPPARKGFDELRETMHKRCDFGMDPSIIS